MAKDIKTNKAGVALDGYDTVAYFTEGMPTPGNADISHTWKDATWQFASTANRDLFASDPEKYAPQFGGHCAVARAHGMSVKGSPKRWVIEDDKLFVNKDIVAHKVYPLFRKRINRLVNRAHASS